MTSSDFAPAANKLEAVVRISQLTGSGPEELGPGSKERKSVLTNLSKGLHLQVDLDRSKPQLAEQIAEALGAQWTQDCWSTGQTITLAGLNLLLEYASRAVGPLKLVNAESVHEEARRIADVLLEVTPPHFDGQKAIKEMREAEGPWRQTEWQGWYWEFKSIPALISRLGGGPLRIGSTYFDYQRSHTWDLKSHSSTINGEKKNQSPLNDQRSMEKAIEQGGLGLFVLSGDSTRTREFTVWFAGYRSKAGDPRKNLVSSFHPVRLDAFFIRDQDVFDRAIAEKRITIFKQGPQQSKAIRNLKYMANIKKCRDSELQLFSHTLD